jgi:hypothetical protein
MVLPIQEFYELCDSEACKALHDRSKPLVAEPGQNVYLGYVPVSWDDETDVEDADDWKEVDIVTEGDEQEALAALRAVFGSSAVLG